MKASQAWQATLGQLQMEMPKATYDTWVKDTSFIKHEDATFTISVQNAYARDWLENRLTSTATKMLSGIMDTPQEIIFTLQTNDEDILKQEEETVPVKANIAVKVEREIFNSRYSFLKTQHLMDLHS